MVGRVTGELVPQRIDVRRHGQPGFDRGAVAGAGLGLEMPVHEGMQVEVRRLALRAVGREDGLGRLTRGAVHEGLGVFEDALALHFDEKLFIAVRGRVGIGRRRSAAAARREALCARWVDESPPGKDGGGAAGDSVQDGKADIRVPGEGTKEKGRRGWPY